MSASSVQAGIAKCASPEREQAKVDLLLKIVIELPFDQAAAREAGRIQGLLKSQNEQCRVLLLGR